MAFDLRKRVLRCPKCGWTYPGPVSHPAWWCANFKAHGPDDLVRLEKVELDAQGHTSPSPAISSR